MPIPPNPAPMITTLCGELIAAVPNLVLRVRPAMSVRDRMVMDLSSYGDSGAFVAPLRHDPGMLYDRLARRARVGDGFDDVRAKAIETHPWLVAAAGEMTAEELHRRLMDCGGEAGRRAAALTLMLAAEP